MSGRWSRSVVTGTLLGLVASENAIRVTDRLQASLDEREELEQLAGVQPWATFETKLGGRLLSHPDGNVEALAARGLQGVGGWWPLPAFPDPQRMVRQGVKTVVDPNASITRSLL